MTVTIVEIEKLDGKGGFSLWKAKIKALLGQQQAHKFVLDPSKLLATLITSQREDMKLNTYGTIILNLSDSVIRQVTEEDTTYKSKRN